MYYMFVLIAVLLSLSLLFSVIKSGSLRLFALLFRIFVVAGAIIFFTVVFVQSSIDQFKKNSLAIQVINKLPQPIDFYLFKINKDADNSEYVARHLGVIRTNFYRLEFEDMKKSDEIWIAGILGKEKMVYFSQHSIPNKNIDQIIEVRSYLNQSMKLSDIAKSQITHLKAENMKAGIWFTLDALLIFLNLVLLFRRKAKNPA